MELTVFFILIILLIGIFAALSYFNSRKVKSPPEKPQIIKISYSAGYGVYYDPYSDGIPIIIEKSMSSSGSTKIRMGPREALEPELRNHFRKAEAEWFIPFIEKLLIGKRFHIDDLEGACLKATGNSLEFISG